MTTYTQKRWSLNDLYPSHESPEFKNELKSLEEAVEEFENQRSKLTSDIDDSTFKEIIKQLDGITHKILLVMYPNHLILFCLLL